MDVIDSCLQLFKKLADDGRFVNCAIYADAVFMKIFSKCYYLQPVLSAQGEPIFSFEESLDRKQEVFSQWMLIPKAFMIDSMKLDKHKYTKIAVFLSSPFALIKDKVMSFITLHQSLPIDIYLSSDSDLVMNNNVQSVNIQQNVERLISPLDSVVEFINSASVHAFSINVNAIPLFYCNYARTSLVMLTDASFNVELYNQSDEQCAISILRCLNSYDLNVNEYIFYLGADRPCKVASILQEVYQSRADNNGYSLIITDHSSDLLSPSQHLLHPDILAFLHVIGISTDFCDSSIAFSSSESDVGTILKEFLKNVNSIDSIPQNAFLITIVGYLEDICLEEGISFDKYELKETSSIDTILTYLKNLNTHIKKEKNIAYFETTSFIDRYLIAFEAESKQPCKHDFFNSILDRFSDADLFFHTPCSHCGALPTLQELIECILIVAAAGILDPTSIETLLSSCCQNCDYQQLCQVNRIISSDQLSDLQSTSPEVIQNACKSICSQDGPLMQIVRSAISHRNQLHSSHFKHPMGHFICDVLNCSDEPNNASKDPNIASNSDIFSTKVPKPVQPQQGYFSFFKSFISVERESLCKDREGIILACLDGLSDYEVLDLLIKMKQINDSRVKDLIVCSCSYDRHINLPDIFRI